jgi:hypothetical protein
MPDRLIGKAVKGIAGGIGLASEGISHYKQRKEARKGSSSDSPPPYTETPDEKTPFEDKDEKTLFDENDEEQWDLDNAQDELSLSTSSNEPPAKTERDVHKITSNFIARYPPPQYTSLAAAPKLPLPVLLPQRRPKDRARGFICAYAPVLAECGIDQDMFLNFLKTFNQASQASPWINAINLAGFATMALPMGIGIAVQAAITIAVNTATEVHARHRFVFQPFALMNCELMCSWLCRTNTFLDTINDEFFRPRGLYCLVMTWNPESDETHTSVNLISTITSSANEHNSSLSGMSKLKHNLKRSSGNTYGELDFPETAPLIFPGLDNLQEQTGEEAKSKREKLNRTGNFVSDYWDRRAQAEYAGQNPGSALAKTPKPSFTSRYADPNHPANSGSLISLVTGGYINPPRRKGVLGLGGLRGSLGGGYDSRHGRDYSGGNGESYGRGFGAGEGRRGLRRGRGGGMEGGLPALNPIKGVKKLLTKKVLYLMIVNIPSNEELAAANQQVAGFQQAAAAEQAC